MVRVKQPLFGCLLDCLRVMNTRRLKQITMLMVCVSTLSLSSTYRTSPRRLALNSRVLSVSFYISAFDAYVHPQFVSDVMRPMKIDPVLDQEVQNLSGGELQRVAMALALGKPADVYLIDEPSAYLDSEQRITSAKVIKRFIMHAKKTAFIVEHDFIMATYLADRVVVYTGQPGIEATATAPQGLLTGMNQFLAQLRITFRRDPTNYRPRINKADSVKDREQKANGNFFFMDNDDDEL
mmetsp:Transcript_98015/g.280419  ORF Transcript_98015/g.280419 Transcript_98015/m.280419 type:complete len:238 (-) Transcript_98015:166-879(-)